MDIGKRKKDGAQGAAQSGMVFYVNGDVTGTCIGLVFSKEYAKAFAKGLLEAAEVDDNMKDVGMELDVRLHPRNKMIVTGGGGIQ